MSAVDPGNLVHCPSRGSVTLGECLEDFREDGVNRHVAGARPTSCSRCSQGRTRKAAAEGRRVPPATTATPAPPVSQKPAAPRPAVAPTRAPAAPATTSTTTATAATAARAAADATEAAARTQRLLDSLEPLLAAARVEVDTLPERTRLAVERAAREAAAEAARQLGDAVLGLVGRMHRALADVVQTAAQNIPDPIPATTATPAPTAPATATDERMARVALAASEWFHNQNRANRRELDLAVIAWERARRGEPGPEPTPAPPTVAAPTATPALAAAEARASAGLHRSVNLDGAPALLLRAALKRTPLVLSDWLVDLRVSSRADRMRYWRAASWAEKKGYLRRTCMGIYEITKTGQGYASRLESAAAAAGVAP